MERRERARRRNVSPEGNPISSLITEALRAPLDEASFMRYYRVAMRAASAKGPAPSAKDRVMQKLEGGSETVVDVVFGDDPLSRMAIALKNQMTKERRMDRFRAVSSRILALILLIGGGSLKRWAISLPHDPQHLYYPDAVVLVAAVAPLVDDLTFEAHEFMRLLELRLGGITCGRLTASE